MSSDKKDKFIRFAKKMNTLTSLEVEAWICCQKSMYATTADIMSNWSYICNADIMSNREDIRNNCGYNTLYEIPNPLKKPKDFNKLN